MRTVTCFTFFMLIAFLQGTVYSQPVFNQHLISGQIHGTQSLYACDLDGDGDEDILGAASEDNDIVWWRNNGGSPVSWTKIIVDGSFAGAGTVYGADINADSLTDIIGGAKSGDKVAWWENSGGDTIIWTKHVIRNGYDFPHEVFAFDLDRDANMDVLAASSLQNEITWWKNNGEDSIVWTEQSIDTLFTQAKSVHVGYFNNDTLPDVVGASLLDNKIIWWENNGGTPIHWTGHVVTSTFSGAHRVQAADIDSDGKDDILCAGWYANKIAWWRNNGGNPVIWTYQEIATDFLKTCIGLAVDLDGDSDMDVVGTAQDGDEVAWFRNDGGSQIVWTKLTIDGSFDRVWPVCAADFDGDGDIDVAAASGHEGNNEMRWYEQTPENMLDNPEHVAYDNVNNRYLVTNYGNGKIIQIDSAGNQEVIIEGIAGCLGIHIVDTTIFISAGHNIHLYGLMSHTFLQTLTLNVSNWVDGMTDDGTGNLYAAENSGKIHKVSLTDFSDTIIVNGGLPSHPQDLAYDPVENRLLLVCWGTNSPIVGIDLNTFVVSDLVQTSSGQYDGIVRDEDGNLFVTSWMSGGRVYKWEPPYTEDPVVFSQGHAGPAGLALNPEGHMLAVPNFNGNTISYLSLIPSWTGDNCQDLEFSLKGLALYISSTESIRVSVTDMAGRMVFRQSYLPGDIQIYLDQIPGMRASGIYIITAMTKSSNRSLKLIR